MPTVSKDIAEQQIVHCKTLKRPKMYCIVKYANVLFGKDGYCLCYKEEHYLGLFESPAVSNVEILWASVRSGLTVAPPVPDRSPLITNPEIEDELMFAIAEERAQRFQVRPLVKKKAVGRRRK